MTDRAQLLADAGWAWPEGSRPIAPRACRGCGRVVLFVVTRNGAESPHDHGTGVSHFATCPEAWRFRKPARDRRRAELVDRYMRDALWALVRDRDVPDRVRQWARSSLGLDEPRASDGTLEA